MLLVAVRVADGQTQRAILSNAGATFEAAVCTADMFRLGTNVAVVTLEDAALAEHACARVQVRAIGVQDGRPGHAFVREAGTVAVAVVSFLALAALKAADGVDARLVRVARVVVQALVRVLADQAASRHAPLSGRFARRYGRHARRRRA